MPLARKLETPVLWYTIIFKYFTSVAMCSGSVQGPVTVGPNLGNGSSTDGNPNVAALKLK